MEILAYFCNSEEGLNKLENLDRFKEFNKRMQQVFEGIDEDTLYNYIIKTLIRKYGSGSIKHVLDNENCKWITPNRIIGDNLVSNLILKDNKNLILNI